MARLIVGLGNPGREYEFTRHNIGWLALDQLSFFDQLVWTKKFKGLLASHHYEGEKVFFLKPMTFMNRSGESVGDFCSFYKVSPANILVIHDDLDFPLGTMAFKEGGGTAGHNGLKSIKSIFGEGDFNRLRLGIGRPMPVQKVVSDHVLGSFNDKEVDLLKVLLPEAAKAIELYMEKGLSKASNTYSKKAVSVQGDSCR